MPRILPSITTHGHGVSTWRDKISEVSQLGLREIGLFVTGLSTLERFECYELLETTQKHHSFKIPFVHAVSTMPEYEFLYLMHAFGVEYFNLHPVREYRLEHPLSADLREKILIENTKYETPLSEGDLEGFAGICFDVSHLEDARRIRPRTYDQLISLAEKIPVFANHISAVNSNLSTMPNGVQLFSNHVSAGKEDFNYLFSTPSRCFSKLCAIELENSLTEQVALIPIIQAAIAESEREDSQKIAA